MSSNLLHTVGVIGGTIKEKKSNSGTTIAEFLVFFNDYVPTVGKTALEVYATVWGERAEKLIEESKKHKKDGQLTGGKGMSVFLIGYLHTHTYQDSRYTKLHVLDWLFNEAPVFHGRGVLGDRVNIKTVQLRSGKATVTEVPVYFNGYIPGVGQTSFETYVTLWRDKAEWLYEQADKHKNQQGSETGGKGMSMEFVCYEHTDKFEHNGQKRSVAKLVAVDVKFPNITSNNKKESSLPASGQEAAQNPKPEPLQAKSETPLSDPFEEEIVGLPDDTNGTEIELELDTPGESSNLLEEFDRFLNDTINMNSDSGNRIG